MKKIIAIYLIAVLLILFGVTSKNEYLFKAETLAHNIGFSKSWDTVVVETVDHNLGQKDLTAKTEKNKFRSAQLLWESEKKNTYANAEKELSLSLDDKQVYAVFDDGMVGAFDLLNGNLNWSFQSKSLNANAYMLKVLSVVILASSEGSLYCLNAKNGNLLWYRKLNANISGLFTFEDKIIIKENAKIGDMSFFYVLNISNAEITKFDFNPNKVENDVADLRSKLRLKKDETILNKPVIFDDKLAVMIRLGGLRVYKISN